ncbi:MAG: hypothetical protein OXI87_08215 [Albidovulum sp.]|nr:hypothetical protein [Albidovulum sp.]MDE0530120.1 hypothetical protein [Albidovulum sp.]
MEEFANSFRRIPAVVRAVLGVLELAAMATLRDAASEKGRETRRLRVYKAKSINCAEAFANKAVAYAIRCPMKRIEAGHDSTFLYLPTFEPGNFGALTMASRSERRISISSREPEACVLIVREFMYRPSLLNP